MNIDIKTGFRFGKGFLEGKHDIVTAIIYYCITTCSFIMQNVTLVFQCMAVLCMGKNINRHFSQTFEFFYIFVINIIDLNAITSIC